MSSQNRDSYRIAYTRGDHPETTLNGKRVKLLDVSERGLRFTVAFINQFQTDDVISGTVNFLQGHRETVEGTVLRQIGNQYVVILSPPIPFSTIMNEQRFLIKKYGNKVIS